MIENFIIKEPLAFAFGRSLDYEKIIAIPDEDFAGLYLELMSEYKDKDGWWSNEKIPKCSQCHAEISGPQDLRRYYGNSMHASCFKEFYEREGSKDQHQEKTMKRYWARVANLALNP